MPGSTNITIYRIPVQYDNTWYVSDYGSDTNDCHSESAPCKNLQTVLDRAADGADIYVTSTMLSICTVNSSISFNMSGINGLGINVTCSGV